MDEKVVLSKEERKKIKDEKAAVIAQGKTALETIVGQMQQEAKSKKVLDTVAELAEFVKEKSGISKEDEIETTNPLSPSPYYSEYYVLVKPQDVNEWPTWTMTMDVFDGLVLKDSWVEDAPVHGYQYDDHQQGLRLFQGSIPHGLVKRFKELYKSSFSGGYEFNTTWFHRIPDEIVGPAHVQYIGPQITVDTIVRTTCDKSLSFIGTDSAWWDMKNVLPPNGVEPIFQDVTFYRQTIWNVGSLKRYLGLLHPSGAAYYGGLAWEYPEKNGNVKSSASMTLVLHCKDCNHSRESKCTQDCQCCCNEDGLSLSAWYLEKRLHGRLDEASITSLLVEVGSVDSLDWRIKVFGPQDAMFVDASQFYALEHCVYHRLGDIERMEELRRETGIRLGERIKNYVTYACIGEVRHADSRWLAQDSIQPVRLLHNAVSGSGLNRTGAWRAGEVLSAVFGDKAVLQSLVNVFNNGKWRSGYGGKKWGVIAQLGLDYETGAITRNMFIDMIMSAVHNGGWAFNKWYEQQPTCCTMHKRGGITFQRLLDAKAADARRIPKVVCLPKEINELLVPEMIVVDKVATEKVMEALMARRKTG